LSLYRRQKIAKITKTPYFRSSRSFKVIDVDTIKKHVTSACYDKQHVCAYLQGVFTLGKPIAENNHVLENTPL